MTDATTPTTFTDLAGRAWPLSITVADLRTVREATGVDLAALTDDHCRPLVDLLGKDPVRFGLVLFTLVRTRADATGVTEEEFMRALAGDPLEAAADAFVGALANFSPRRVRECIRLLWTKGKEVSELAQQQTAERIRDAKPARILSGWSASAGGPPESPGSTRGPSHSGSSKKRPGNR